MLDLHDTYYGEKVSFNQYEYPHDLYESETHTHAVVIDEYLDDVTQAMHHALERTKPNTRLIAHQPHLDPISRFKLLDFGLKLSVRLKILPFVFCRAVRLFDRYCSKRIVLSDQGQLVIATCLWIAAKVHGGNCHFANMHSERPSDEVRSVQDLGYGSGARFNGPTQRYRLPRVAELVKLCGSRCNYSPKMFNQMELYIMGSLDWDVAEPGIDDYLLSSDDLNINRNSANCRESPVDIEFRRMKQFAAYAACFSYDAIGFDTIQVAKTSIDVINRTFRLSESDPRFQVPNRCVDVNDCEPDYIAYNNLCKVLVAAITHAPVYLLELFGDKGPQQLYFQLTSATLSMALDSPKKSPLLAPAYPSPSASASPDSAHFCESPVTPKEYTYEQASRTSKHGNRFLNRPSTMIDGEELCPRSFRQNLAEQTPSSASLNSRPYPSFLPPTSSFYNKNNASESSVRSYNSSKVSEIFDSDRPRPMVYTPASSETTRNETSFADASAPLFKKLP